MKNFLKNRRLQKFFLPLAFLCILPVWILLRRGISPVPPILYVLIALAAALLLLDRLLKPWELDRLEKEEKKAKEQGEQPVNEEKEEVSE